MTNTNPPVNKRVRRNKKIIELLKSGDWTLQEVGEKYGISRQRVEQIWKDKEERPFKERRLKEKIKKLAKNREYLRSIKFFCKGCTKPVNYAEGSHKQKFCSDCWEILYIQNRKPDVTLNCHFCKKPFHPYRNWRTPSIGKRRRNFCKFECYQKQMKLDALQR